MSKKAVDISFYERQKIELWIRFKQPYRQIGRRLGRDHTVISREVARNISRDGIYRANEAEEKARRRERKTNQKIMDKNPHLRRFVIKKLRDEQLSPEQISGQLKRIRDKWLGSVSYETIYQWIYTDGKWLYPYLRKKRRPERNHRCDRKPRVYSAVPGKVSIHERPKVVNDKKRLGDWESDSVKFSKQKEGLSVQYERKSMLVRITKVANLGKDETYRALTESIDSLPQYLFHSITFDNGGEGARHVDIRREYNLETYFCDPYKSWQKGGVENINGLIRQYLPRKTKIDTITDAEIKVIQERLNNRPRKSLGYLTPNEFIQREISQRGGAVKP